MAEEESQVFRGDGHLEEGEVARTHAKKPTPKPAAAPAPAAPVVEQAPVEEAVVHEEAAAPAPNPADQDLDFTVDKSTLWQMSEEMKARVSQMASMSASTNQQLDMQEKNLRKLQKKNK
jgi:hypothetical protein